MSVILFFIFYLILNVFCVFSTTTTTKTWRSVSILNDSCHVKLTFLLVLTIYLFFHELLVISFSNHFLRINLLLKVGKDIEDMPWLQDAQQQSVKMFVEWLCVQDQSHHPCHTMEHWPAAARQQGTHVERIRVLRQTFLNEELFQPITAQNNSQCRLT